MGSSLSIQSGACFLQVVDDVLVLDLLEVEIELSDGVEYGRGSQNDEVIDLPSEFDRDMAGCYRNCRHQPLDVGRPECSQDRFCP